jgi:four helix bundle protein
LGRREECLAVCVAGLSRFEDLVAWQLCVRLGTVVFEMTASGAVSKDFEFRDHIREAADASAPLIAEGFRRFTTAEFVRYLRMARGELGEVQSKLIAGAEKKYFVGPELERAQTLANRAMGTTTNLLKAKLQQLEQEQQQKRRKRTRKPRKPRKRAP